ncbi:hypothetical protein, partial [Endozoicomonas sp. SESOKO4]|uniref:hypothetical protein n=1 Tax=Endozoicomonas sp. SESOKO4 TaxID=2828745 RepID=UPI0021498A15
MELQKQHESGEFIITELPEMDLQEARTFLDTTLSNQLKERSLDHEIRVPCNRQSRKCDVEIYLFNQRESSKQLTEIIRFTVLLNLRPATVNTDSDHSSKIDKSGNNAHSGLEEESESHCIAIMSCPSASTTETAVLQESGLPDLDPDWMDRVHVYRNQENGDNL